MGTSLGTLMNKFGSDEELPTQAETCSDSSLRAVATHPPFDPRSPSVNVERTPIQLAGPVHHIHDPRSPSDGIQRTPIITQDLIVVKRKGVGYDVFRYKNKSDETNAEEEEEASYNNADLEYNEDNQENEGSYIGEVGCGVREVRNEDYNGENEEEIDIVESEEGSYNVEDAGEEGSCDVNEDEQESISEIFQESVDKRARYGDSVFVEGGMEEEGGSMEEEGGMERGSMEERLARMERKLMELQTSPESASSGRDFRSWSQLSALKLEMRSARSRSVPPHHHNHKSGSGSARGNSVDRSGGLNNAFVESSEDDSCSCEAAPTLFRLTSEDAQEEACSVERHCSRSKVLRTKPREGKVLTASTPIQSSLKKPRPEFILLEEALKNICSESTTPRGHKCTRHNSEAATSKIYLLNVTTTPKTACRKPLALKNTPIVVQPKLLIRNQQIRKLKENFRERGKEN